MCKRTCQDTETKAVSVWGKPKSQQRGKSGHKIRLMEIFTVRCTTCWEAGACKPTASEGFEDPLQYHVLIWDLTRETD